MAALSAFLPYLLPHVPACSEPYAIQALRSACIEFCSKTLLFQEVSAYSSVAGVADIELDIPTGAVLSKVLSVMWKRKELDAVTVETVRDPAALRGSFTGVTAEQQDPRVFFQKTPAAAEISLYPIPPASEAGVITVKAAFTPSRVASAVPDFLFEDWVEEIAAGAAVRLMLTPEQPFTNPAMAGVHKQMFDGGLRSAVVQARHGQVVAASRVRLVPFA